MPVITRNQRKISEHKIASFVANQMVSTIDTQVPVVQCQARRSRRKIPKVDYTGMDTIEPESEFDGITDIWADLTIYEDPDYEFEEEEEDDEEYENYEDEE